MKGVETGFAATISEGAAALEPSREMSVTGSPLNEDADYTSRRSCADLVSVPVEIHEVSVGTVFETLQQAREKCTEYANCPLGQKSSKHLKFISFVCFRGGQATKKPSSVSTEFQREKKSAKCQCPFVIKLRLIQASGFYEVYKMNNQHNHGFFTEAELAQLPQNRFIPNEVKTKMLELKTLGMSYSQIQTLIEQEHFPNVPVTWTTRDIQNLVQKTSNRARQRWLKDTEDTNVQSVSVETALVTRPTSEVGATQRQSEDRRLSELTVLTMPILRRSIETESTFQLYKASMTVLGETIENLRKSQHFVSDLEDDTVRDPSNVSCKGRPKPGNKRHKSLPEQLQNKNKDQRGVTFSSGGQPGHGV